MRNEALIRARQLRGWSQLRVAQQIGATSKQVSDWERGEYTPGPMYQERLCQLFGCDAQALGFIVSSVPVLGDDLLSAYQQGILALHDLYFRGYPSQVQAILPLYARQTAALVQPGPLSKSAGRAASLAWQLTCELATDREDFGAAYQAGQQALRYAQIAEDKNLQVASLIGRATLHFHRRQSTASVHTFQRAIALFDESVTPLLRGRTLAGIAEVYAMRQEEQEALRAMGQAYEVYPMAPEEDPAYPYLHASRYALYVFGDVQSRLFLQQPREADSALDALKREQNTDTEQEPGTKMDFLFYRAESFSQQNELEASLQALEEAALLARRLGSRLYFGKLTETYEALRARWPQERKILQLDEIFS